MEREGLAPGVEDGAEAELSVEVLRIASKRLERLARRAEEQIVEDPRSGEGQRAQLVRQREDDMEVGDGEQIGAARREPILLGEELTLGAVAVATGVVDGTPMPAAVTLITYLASWVTARR
jgi:hypothetical protein